MDHSFEMLLKSSIIHTGGKIIEKGAQQTIGFSACVRKAFSDGKLKFLNEEQILTLQTLNGLRDAAQHTIDPINVEINYAHELTNLQQYANIPNGIPLFQCKIAFITIPPQADRFRALKASIHTNNVLFIVGRNGIACN